MTEDVTLRAANTHEQTSNVSEPGFGAAPILWPGLPRVPLTKDLRFNCDVAASGELEDVSPGIRCRGRCQRAAVASGALADGSEDAVSSADVVATGATVVAGALPVSASGNWRRTVTMSCKRV